MDDFPARLAGFLEDVAGRARALTVDRAENLIRLTTLGVVAGSFAFMAVVFLLLTIYRALEIPLQPWGAYAVLTGLFAITGVLMWAKRSKDRDR
jgi:hypothetical protein